MTSMAVDKLMDSGGTKKARIQIEKYFSQLLLDGYATSESKQILGPNDVYGNPRYILTYTITLKGELFINRGGYVQRAKDIAYEQTRIENAEKNLRRHGFWIKFGAVGAFLSAAAYLIWDILKFLLEHYPYFPCLNCPK